LYVKSLQLENFKCFGKASMKFQYPGRPRSAAELKNVNLVLGDNGGGKSSVLRAIAIAVLAPVLADSGFVPYRLVRRAGTGVSEVETALVGVKGLADRTEVDAAGAGRQFPLDAVIRKRGGDNDRIAVWQTQPWLEPSLFDETSAKAFIVGYGATRRIEISDYSESSARRSRGLRYARVASLFEDHVALRPIQVWAERLKLSDGERYTYAIKKFNQALPEAVRFTGELGNGDRQPMFMFRDVLTPLSSLSDGYKSFIGWVGDLIGHLSDVADEKYIDDIPGIVLLDEIDLHLHPEWQRIVVPTLARAFPKLQFIFTSHSPLIASTVKRENVFVTDVDESGAATIRQLEERLYGRSIEELLVSSYFGLTTTRPESFQDQSRELFLKAAAGDSSAALEYLQRLTGVASDNTDPEGN
jgi:predicted ATPase